jgi:hypothetical protein
MRGAVMIALAAGASLVMPAVSVSSMASAHPLHTSIAQIRHDTKTGLMVVSLRVFADDFGKAARDYQQHLPSSDKRRNLPASDVYALSSFRIADDRGRLVPLETCGEKNVGDLLWLCFKSGPLPLSSALFVSSRILFEMYSDQINVVQAEIGGKQTNRLFTVGTGFKALR